MPSQDPERRRAPRYNVTFSMVCDSGDAFGSAVVVNLSDSGALVQTEDDYAEGDKLSLVPVGEAGDILFDLPATVVRILDDPGPGRIKRYGVRFSGLTLPRIRALRTLCAAMPPTPDELPESEAPQGGPARSGSEPHFRIRTRVGGSPGTPRWARRPFG
ncbi:MAG: PilZ domain-containing protein [Nannocystales bacterium]